MFSTSLILLIKALALNILLPLIPGVLLILSLYPSLLKGRKLHIVGWFLGVGLIANRIFDSQFLGLGVGTIQYGALVIILGAVLLVRMWKGGLSKNDLLQAIKIERISGVKELFATLPSIEKRLIIIGGLFVGRFFINSFIHTINFPTYADDSFGNRNRQAINIYYDEKINVVGEKEALLGKGGAIGYPIHIATYKAIVADFMGGWHDNYMKLFQWFGLLFIIIFSIIITFEKTKNLLYSIIPGILICGLPLVFWHSIDAYQELSSVYFTVIAIRLLYEYLEKKQIPFIVLATFVLRTLSYIKNDGFVIYMPSVVIGFLSIILLQGRFNELIKEFFADKSALALTIGGIILMLVPFIGVKLYHGLGFNPTQTASTGSTSSIHREIFSQFKSMFLIENNYNIALVFVVLIGILIYWYYNQNPITKSKEKEKVILVAPTTPTILFPIITSLTMFILFTGVFLLTENYQWVMNQTTSNRVYTMCFIVFFYFSGIALHELQRKK